MEDALVRGVESLDGVVEVEKAGSRPPEMVLRVNAVAAMLTTPVLVVKGLRYRRQVAATDVSFDEKFGEQLVGVRWPFDRHVAELAGRQRVEGALVTAASRAPDPDRAFDRMVPDRPLRGTPPPGEGQLREPQHRNERLEVRGARHPRHNFGLLADDERDFDPVEIGIGVQQCTEYERAGDRRIGPLAGTIEPIADVREPAHRRRVLHHRIVPQPAPRTWPALAEASRSNLVG